MFMIYILTNCDTGMFKYFVIRFLIVYQFMLVWIELIPAIKIVKNQYENVNVSFLYVLISN